MLETDFKMILILEAAYFAGIEKERGVEERGRLPTKKVPCGEESPWQKHQRSSQEQTSRGLRTTALSSQPFARPNLRWT